MPRQSTSVAAAFDPKRTSSLKDHLTAGAKDQACPPTEAANSIYCSLPFSLASWFNMPCEGTALVKDADPICPTKLRVEAATACQLACPTCPTAEGRIDAALGRGFLRADNFRRLLDQAGGSLQSVELSNFGEAFFNPQLLDIFQIAHERNVSLTINNGANLNNVREEVLEGLVKYRVRILRCSIDGTTQQVYAVYRRNGTLDTVLGNIKKINEFKAVAGSRYPELVWQFVVFGHNQHQVAGARLMARILGMSFFAKLSWDTDFSPVTEVEELERQLGHAATRERFLTQNNAIYFESNCQQLWQQPQINFNGQMLGCCKNYWTDFGGNAFDDLNAAINSPRMIYARAMLQGEAPPRDDIPCTKCDLYAARRRLERWVVPEEAATDFPGPSDQNKAN